MIKPSSHGSPWTTDERSRLASELTAGRTVAQMAEAHGRTPGAIVGELTRMGLVVKVGRSYRIVGRTLITFDQLDALKD